MADIHNVFAERFLRVQIMFNPPAPSADGAQRSDGAGRNGGDGRPAAGAPRRRFNALGILEEVNDDETLATDEPAPAEDMGPGEPPANERVVRKDPVVVGAGRTRSLSAATRGAANVDFSSAKRNDPCPCGSGKKFKKCHGANG